MKINLPLPVLFVIEKLQENGFEAYLVGGAVRDALLSRELITDWDFTTNATPEQILPLFKDSFYDNAFGTVMVAVEHLLEQIEVNDDELAQAFAEYDVFDITTYRSEEGYTNRRHPDKVSWGKSLEEDVKRRDFTINSLAFQIQSSSEKLQASVGKAFLECEVELVDYFDGRKDLDAELIRAVGDAKGRFEEDSLRMMRAIRFGAQLGFLIEEETREAITSTCHLIADISAERVRDELFKILASTHPADGILLLHSTGLLKHFLPEMLEMLDVPQGGHHIYDVWKHSVESLRECPSSDPLVRFATLLHDIGKPRTMKKQGPRGVTFYGHEVVGAHMSKEIADRLRLSKKQKQKLFTLIRWHMFHYEPKMTDSAIRRFIRRVGVENINDMMMLRVGDRKGGGSRATSWRLREFQQRIGENLYEPLSVKDLKIDGLRVMEILEIKPSKRVGEILNQLFEEVMDEKIENSPDLLEKRVMEMGV